MIGNLITTTEQEYIERLFDDLEAARQCTQRALQSLKHKKLGDVFDALVTANTFVTLLHRDYPISLMRPRP